MHWLIALLVIVVSVRPAWADLGSPLGFTGMCDASAAVAVDEDLFLVANDEDNLLRGYRLSRPGAAIHTWDLRQLLGLNSGKELDIEGAARLGQRIFWITSHGQDKDGDIAPNRHRLFALRVSDGAAGVRVEREGAACTDLVARLAADPRLAAFQLAKAARLAPKAPGGLSIEALTDTPEGTLLIGFRNPIPEGRALVVPLLNPERLLAGEDARFGEPIQLDLGGLGLRGMGSVEEGYYLLAGPAQGDGQSRLFFWAGVGTAPQLVPSINLAGLNPEGICFHDSGLRTDFLLLSDDGSRNVNGTDCKDLPPGERAFRAYRVSRWMPTERVPLQIGPGQP